MLTGYIRFVMVSAVFAFAAHGAGIGVDGTSCSGDPSFNTQIVTINADPSGNLCPVYSNDLPGGDNGGGQTIGSLTFVTGLSASPSDADFTCFTNTYFDACTVLTDPNNDLLTIRFFNPFIGNLDFRGTTGVPPGSMFDIDISGFSPNQSFDVAANEPAAPEPGSVALLLAGGLGCLLLRRRAHNR